MNAPCSVCGNTYALAFQVRAPDGETYTFDSFECAIHELAPTCAHCGCKIIGHGAEVSGRFYCCAHCARSSDQPAGDQIQDSTTPDT